MKRLFRYTFYLILFLILSVIGLIITGFVLEDRLISVSISQLNKHLNAKINVQNVEVSLVKGFPYASIILNHVDIKEGSLNTPPEFEPGLLSFEKVILRIGLWGIFKNQYNIDELIFNNGWINLYFDNSGKGNFEIFQSYGSSSANWLLELNAIRLNNVNISYIDIRTGWVMKGIIDDGFVKGEITQQYQSLSIKTKLKVGLVKQGAFHFFRNQSISVSSKLKVTEDNVQFEKGFVEMAGSTYRLSGFMGRKIGSPISLKIDGANIESEFLLSFLTQFNYAIHPKTKTKGKISFDFAISGYNKVDLPFTFTLSFFSDKFSFTLPDKPTVNIAKLSGSFTNGPLGKAESSEISVNFNNVRAEDIVMAGTLKIKNIFSPLFHLKLTSAANLSALKLWGIETPFESGMVNGSFEALGRLDQTENIKFSDFYNTKVHSSLNFTNLNTRSIAGFSFENVAGSLELANRNLGIPNVKGKVNGSLFDASVNVGNVYALIFSKGKSHISSTLSIDSLKTSWFWGPSSDEITNNGSNANYWENIANVTVDVHANELIYNDVTCTPASFTATILENSFSLNHFRGYCCNGTFSGQVSATNTSDNSYLILSNVDIQKADVSTLFKSFNNFDQSIIKSENISGLLTGSWVLKSTMENGVIQTPSVESSASLRIENGRLRDVEQLKALSRFVSLDDLADIKFETIENNISIENSVVIIPQMDIVSSALNLSLSGKHKFDGNYQYHVQLLLSDILFGKAAKNKAENQEFGVVASDQSGKSKLHLKLVGDLSDYKVSYDGEAARQAFIQNARDEGKNLKEILGEEFKIFKRREKTKLSELDSTNAPLGDTLLNKKSDNTSRFVIDWDDE